MADAESSPNTDKISLFDRLFNDNSNQQSPPTSSGFIQTPFGLSMEQFSATAKAFLPGEGSILYMNYFKFI
jgi:hypothetical protein